MKEPTFNGRELLPLSVMEAAHAGDEMAMEQVLRYYDDYMSRLCTRTLYDKDGTPHVCVDIGPLDKVQLISSDHQDEPD